MESMYQARHDNWSRPVQQWFYIAGAGNQTRRTVFSVSIINCTPVITATWVRRYGKHCANFQVDHTFLQQNRRSWRRILTQNPCQGRRCFRFPTRCQLMSEMFSHPILDVILLKYLLYDEIKLFKYSGEKKKNQHNYKFSWNSYQIRFHQQNLTWTTELLVSNLDVALQIEIHCLQKRQLYRASVHIRSISALVTLW